VRKTVNERIVELMKNLADESGYEHPERVSSHPGKAIEWFYSYVNEPSALRTYAFEVWEGYYVSLYLSLASAASFVVCLALRLIFTSAIALAFAGLSAVIFVALWAVRHWSTIPKIMRTPSQQMGEISPSGAVLKEARRRFD
jgi:hypothetical protein